jgi:hypothetical protein
MASVYLNPDGWIFLDSIEREEGLSGPRNVGLSKGVLDMLLV